MRPSLLSASLLFCVALATVGGAQAPATAPRGGSASPAPAPTVEQMRKAVAALRGNRISTPNDYDRLTPAQQDYVKSILDGPRSAISGPLGVMMVSPALGDLTQKAMAYARFSGQDGFGTVPPKLNELAILVVARHWSAEYVWNAHHAYAVRVGLTPEVVEAIRTGSRPAAMEKDVEAVYTFATELVSTRRVSDAALQAAKAALGGDRGVVDLVGTMGLYQISSMMVTVDQTPLGPGQKPFFAR